MYKALIVDDNEIDRMHVRKFLEKFNFEVFELPDGSKTLEAVKQHAPDIIFLDIIMPESEGIETILNLRMNEIDLPVVMLSGAQNIDYLHLSQELGASHFLVKPLSEDDIQSILSKTDLT
jgi:CheY-like chemotaxis protein